MPVKILIALLGDTLPKFVRCRSPLEMEEIMGRSWGHLEPHGEGPILWYEGIEEAFDLN